jgi:hypothetical protein
MALGRKIVVRYLALVAAAFVLGYGIFGIREHGLWILLMAINPPGSLVVEPQMAALASTLDWSLGAPLHVWTTQLVCMLVNGVVIFGLVSLTSKLWHALRGHAV